MIFYIWIIKLLSVFVRLSGLGGATSLPGLLIEKFFPQKIKKLSSSYKKIVLVTGTNGKTTTQRCLRHILEIKGKKVVSNKSGANLLRGIISTLIFDRNILGKAKSDICIFEVEEATMPFIVEYLDASYVLVTNLFRDQLDAYGEVSKVREYIVNAIKKSPKAKVYLNKDDSNVNSISTEIDNEVDYFNIRDKRKKAIFYERKLRRKHRRNVDIVYAGRIKIQEDLSTEFNIYLNGQIYRNVRFEPPGLQNVYNAVSSIAIASDMYKLSKSEVINAFSTFRVAFGRGESVKIGKKSIRLLLVKNPASLTANMNMLLCKRDLKLMIILNDNIADGTDISWIWDAELESMSKTNIASLTISGKRAYDLNVRFKYAEIKAMSKEVEPNISRALDLALSKLNEGETLFILPTYTGMLEVRKVIGSIVKLSKFWQ